MLESIKDGRLLSADIMLEGSNSVMPQAQRATCPERIDEASFIVINYALAPSSYHILNIEVLAQFRSGVRLMNVGRGLIIDQSALEAALHSAQGFSAVLDVFETEPLRSHPRCVFGSRNASNIADSVARTSEIAIGKLVVYLGCHAK